MATVTIRLTGFKELELGLERWGAEVQQRFVDELETVKDETVAELQRVCPVGPEDLDHPPGTLRASIMGRLEQPHSQVPGMRIRATAPHAWLVEHGHQGPHPAPPHPWFVPVVVEARKRLNAAAVKMLEQPLPELGPGTPTVRGGAGGSLL